MQRKVSMLVTIVVTGLVVVGCGPKAPPPTADQPSKLEDINGGDISRVVLTQAAAKRIDVQTAPVEMVDDQGTPRLTIPYAAVLYDVNGDAWAYTNPSPLHYVRQALDIEAIDGDHAMLAAGPPAGTQVVTVGVAELFGSEFTFQEQ